MNKSKIFMMVSIIVLLVSVIGSIGTYAWFTWSSTNNTNLTLSIGKIADITFDTGNSINTNSLSPVFNYTDGEITTFSITNKDVTGANINYSVTLNITNIDEELSNESLKYKLVGNGIEVGSGTFSSVKSGDTIKIVTNKLESGITDFTFYLYIDGNIENDINMMNKNFSGSIEVHVGEVAADYITKLYTNATKTVVTNNDIEYNYATSVSLMNDRLGGTTPDYDAGNIRYYGASPSNYIDIGDRDGSGNIILYRIIGVFKDVTLSDGSKKDLIKVIRNESIGDYSWDTSASTINRGWGINEWSQSAAMKLLNPGYENNKDLDSAGNKIAVNNSLWWKKQSGTCYNDYNNATTTCDFTNTGLSDAVKSKIEAVVWNTGGYHSNSVYPNQIYTYERGNNVIQNPSDGITRNTIWTGKVALMYPSDYGYAADLTKCSQTLSVYNNSTCYNDDWLYNGNSQWLLISHSNFANGVWNVRSNSIVVSVYEYYANGLRPTFYLTPDVSIIDGIGTIDNPYVIE